MSEQADLVKVNIIGYGVVEVPRGTQALELLPYDPEPRKHKVVGVTIDNVLYSLDKDLEKDSNISFLDLGNEDGMRLYTRSLVMLLVRAASEVLPGCKVRMEHTLGNGVYGEIDYRRALCKKDVENIEKRMFEIVEADEPIEINRVNKEDARKLFKQTGQTEKLGMLDYRKHDTVWMHTCGWFHDLTYGNMVPSTGYLDVFRLRYYLPGFILERPRIDNTWVVPEYVEHAKLANIYYEAQRWNKILEVHNLVELNRWLARDYGSSLIRVAEAFHEKKISDFADEIAENIDLIRIVLIAGPSSSGKTTFTHRLGVQLRTHGIRPVPISMDDYFVDRVLTPKDEQGEYDFESLEAIDSELFNDHLIALIQGEEVELPRYNFITGKRENSGETLRLGKKDLLIAEGIHGLNDKLTSSIPKGRKFKIYVSALTQLNLDDHNWVSTTYIRILRRIVRDYYNRGYSVAETIHRWPLVRKGEDKHIFPFQDSADAVFNSALIYELSVLKDYAEPLLKTVSRDDPAFAMVRRLSRFLGYFTPISCSEVPSNSIIREFIGGGCFGGSCSIRP